MDHGPESEQRQEIHMTLLDDAAIVSALAAATGRPHMLVLATPNGVADLRACSTVILSTDIIASLADEGRAIVSGTSFVDGALEFQRIEKALIDNRIQYVTVRLAHSDRSVRIHDGIDCPVVAMPLRAVA
jgi:hypothetical protein